MTLFSNPLAQNVIGTEIKVLYSCECNEFKSISKLYFCKHCTKLRCANCVTQEVDSYFCPNCLENMPSAEAKLKRNRCANCFDCPSCGHTLSVRATTVMTNPLADVTKDNALKKMHYLNCSFCRWTTRDVGLPDQVTPFSVKVYLMKVSATCNSPSGGWPEKELPFGKTLTNLLGYYKQLAHNDKMERERQKMSKRRTNLYLMVCAIPTCGLFIRDRYGYGLSLGKKGSPLSSLISRTSSSLTVQKDLVAPVASDVVEEIDPLPDSYYTQPLALEKELTLSQKLHESTIICEGAKDLYPKHKHLMVRRSQRCKECEHNIFKPEFNPSSIKFKIQLGCSQYCPVIQIVKHEPFTRNESCPVVLSISNPLDTIVNVQFEKAEDDFFGNKGNTAQIEMPSVMIPISAKDATVEFDVIGSSNTDSFEDDPSVVQSRTANKVSIYATVTPLQDAGNVTSTFKLKYDYKMITTPLIRKTEGGIEAMPKPEEHLISHTIYVRVNFGEINVTLC